MINELSFRLKLEKQICEHLSDIWDFQPVQMNQSVFCPLDCFAIRNKQLFSIIEIRTRKERLQDVTTWGGILLNFDKLQKNILLSRQFSVPFVFVAYFINDKTLTFVKITDKNGNIQTEMKLISKNAQDNLEGGTEKKRIRNVVMIPKLEIINRNIKFAI
jgi:hypothetical protein